MKYIIYKFAVFLFPVVIVVIISWVYLNIKVQDNPLLIVLILSFSMVVVGILMRKRTSIKQNTLNFIKKYKHNEEFINAHRETVKACNTLKPYDLAILAKIKKDVLYFSIQLILNEWERVASAINNKVYDEDLLYGAYGYSITTFLVKLRPFIIVCQAANPRLLSDFTKLAIKWQIRLAKDREEKDNKTSQMISTLRALHKTSINLHLESNKINTCMEEDAQRIKDASLGLSRKRD